MAYSEDDVYNLSELLNIKAKLREYFFLYPIRGEGTKDETSPKEYKTGDLLPDGTRAKKNWDANSFIYKVPDEEKMKADLETKLKAVEEKYKWIDEQIWDNLKKKLTDDGDA